LLILASQRIESFISIGGSTESDKKRMTREVRGAMPTSIEWMIMAYVAGEQ
jgi:transient receptor potential cation channel subfamily C